VAPRHRSLAAYERELIGLVLAVRHYSRRSRAQAQQPPAAES